MLVLRLRRWPNIDPTMGECLMFDIRWDYQTITWDYYTALAGVLG